MQCPADFFFFGSYSENYEQCHNDYLCIRLQSSTLTNSQIAVFPNYFITYQQTSTFAQYFSTDEE